MAWVHPDIYAGSELYRLFSIAVELIAEDENLDDKRLNTDVGDFVRAAGPLPPMTLWKEFGGLQVMSHLAILSWRIRLLQEEQKIAVILQFFLHSFK